MSYMLDIMYDMGLQNLSHSFPLSIKHESLPEEVKINIRVEVEGMVSNYSYPRLIITASLDEYKEKTSYIAYYIVYDLDNKREIDFSVRNKIIEVSKNLMGKYLERFYKMPNTLEEIEKCKEDEDYNEKIAKVGEIMKEIEKNVINSSEVKKLFPTLYPEKA